MRRDFSGVLIAEGRKEHHFTWLMEEKGESISLNWDYVLSTKS